MQKKYIKWWIDHEEGWGREGSKPGEQFNIQGGGKKPEKLKLKLTGETHQGNHKGEKKNPTTTGSGKQNMTHGERNLQNKTGNNQTMTISDTLEFAVY